MATIITRSAKGAALSHTEMDANFTNLNTQATQNSTNIAAKQDTLVSGTNIKTINGASLLGTGDVTTIRATLNGTTLSITL